MPESSTVTPQSFLTTTLNQIKTPVHRLGLSFNYGIDAVGVEHAIERGCNYFFWTTLKTGRAKTVVKAALQRDRERYVLSCGPGLGYFGGSVRRAAERILRAFSIEYIDVFQLFWLGKMSAWRGPVVEELVKLRDEGKVRSIGVSIHDRQRAGELAADSPLDLLMIRYNAAHPGAERDIFPQLAKRAAPSSPASIVAYTATSWRKLLSKPSGWDGAVMTAGDCYRYCLTNPHVNVVLCGPASQAEVAQNLDALEQRGALSPDELDWMQRYGKVVHG